MRRLVDICEVEFAYSMPCFSPLDAWYGKEKTSNGKSKIVFSPTQAEQPDAPFKLACGQCWGCRLERSRQWAVRCMHEAQMHEENCFITLTFNPESLEKRDNPLSVNRRDFQLFMKRLRKRIGKKVLVYYCGEYGDRNNRPHYHACIFGHDFKDKILYQERDGIKLYTSPELEELWPFGFNTVGQVTFESAAYVARYVMKKVTGNGKDQVDGDGLKPYDRIDAQTGEIIEVEPEFVGMSRRPAIGASWFAKYKNDVYPNDFVVIDGKKVRPPKYYDRLLEREDEYALDDIKLERLEKALAWSEEQTPERLHARAVAKAKQVEKLERKL
jgi:hypothetical protein